MSTADCTKVTPECPVEATTLGYYPNKPLNIVVAVLFAVAAVIALVLGVRKRAWAYMSFIVAGCLLEMAGYIGRILLSENPWDKGAFELQICAIILAPTITCISLYLTLKELTSVINPALSRLRPRLYPYFFVPADVSCLLVQAIGGGLAAQGSSNVKLLNDGNRAIIAGVALQVVVLITFGTLSADYLWRVHRWIQTPEASPAVRALWTDGRFRIFRITTLLAYAAVQVRCIYRVAEMAGGWGNYIMQDQPSFMVLDSLMMLICVFLLACFQPSIFVRAEFAHGQRSLEEAKDGQRSDTETKAPTPVSEA